MAARETKSAGIPLRSVKSDIDNGTIARVYLFHGEETYLMRSFAAALAKKILSPGAEALDRVVFDGEGRPSRIDLRLLSAEIATPPFLSDRKLVVVRDSGFFGAERKSGGKGEDPAKEPEDEETEETVETGDSTKERPDALVKLLDSVPDGVCLLFLEKKIDRRVKKPLDAVERNGRIVEFATQETHDLCAFVTRSLSVDGLSIEADAVDSMLLRTGGSMQDLVSEIEKLRLYCQGSAVDRITLALVEELCIPDLTGRVFDMTDALGSGRPGEALEILETLVARKEPVQLLLFMLARHVRLLIRAKETPDRSRLASALGLPPSIAGKYADQARSFSFEALEDLHARCFDADSAMKTGRLPERTALEALLAAFPARMRASRRP